jgi:tRNA(fMet)-specific endonuclease VapC
MKYILDTNTAHAFVFGHQQVKNQVQISIRRGSKVGICYPILGELAAGFENSDSRVTSLNQLRKALNILYVWPLEYEAMFEFGRLTAELKRRGRIIGAIDILIAATVSLLEPCTLVTTDTDFQWFHGLTTENWMS